MGAARVRAKMAEAVTLAALHGAVVVDRALGQAALTGRFGEGDLASVIAHLASAPAQGWRRADESASLAGRHRGVGRVRPMTRQQTLTASHEALTAAAVHSPTPPGPPSARTAPAWASSPTAASCYARAATCTARPSGAPMPPANWPAPSSSSWSRRPPSSPAPKTVGPGGEGGPGRRGVVGRGGRRPRHQPPGRPAALFTSGQQRFMGGQANDAPSHLL